MTLPVYSISLQVQQTPDDQFVAERSQGFRLRLIANVVSGFRDPAVFVLQRMNEQESQFTCVASVTQLLDLAVGKPDPETGYFRSAVLDLLFHEPIAASTCLDDINTEIRRLCHEMARVDGTISYQEANTFVLSSTDPLA
jgi:hypothetical protein